MRPTALASDVPAEMPDHKQLPWEDGKIVENYQEHPQAFLLTDTLRPRLVRAFGENNFAVGSNSGIYWKHTSPPLAGCKAPDWYVVPNVPAMLNGEFRRSYVMWNEGVKPLLVVEFVSGDGTEERDNTPQKGKFWVYENGIGAAYYVIFDAFRPLLEVYRLEGGKYARQAPNQHGRCPIPVLGVELGLWEGTVQAYHAPWLRPWDAETGELIPMSEERAEQAEANIDHFQELAAEATERADAERKRADAEREKADSERKRADEAIEKLRLLEEKLRAAGIEPSA